MLMLKCRDFDIYQGFENNKFQKTKAETIVDIIHEAIYDLNKGKELFVEF